MAQLLVASQTGKDTQSLTVMKLGLSEEKNSGIDSHIKAYRSDNEAHTRVRSPVLEETCWRSKTRCSSRRLRRRTLTRSHGSGPDLVCCCQKYVGFRKIFNFEALMDVLCPK